MANTSCTERARLLLQYCLDGRPWPKQLPRDVVDECPAEFFRVVVEGLADLFEPRLCDTYAALFSEAIGRVLPLPPEALVERYERVRQTRKCTVEPANVFVLSRVTLGADIAITRIILEAAKRRFPDAEIHFVGSEKAAELFTGVRHVPVSYPQGGSLRDRLAPGKDLEARLSLPDSIVIDPDSRLTQLGLLPVCPEENYFFFESRSYGGSGGEDLSTLTRRWITEAFDLDWPTAPSLSRHGTSGVAVSFGVGDNPAKRIPDPFESGLLTLLGSRGQTIWIDKGAGGEEGRRVEEAIARSRICQARTVKGSFAAFASRIAQSDLYVGYDSAGQHAAAACGVPLLTIFAGFPSPRFFARWRPTGPGKIEIVKVEDPDARAVLEQVKKGLDSLMP